MLNLRGFLRVFVGGALLFLLTACDPDGGNPNNPFFSEAGGGSPGGIEAVGGDPSQQVPNTGGKLIALMVTDLFQDADFGRVARDIDRLVASQNFNGVSAALSLSGQRRGYIFPGRTKTAVDPRAAMRINEARAAGLRVIVVFRSDWNARHHGRTAERVADEAAYVDLALLNEERQALQSLRDQCGGRLIVQLNLESAIPESVAFYRALADHARPMFAEVWVNFIGEGKAAANRDFPGAKAACSHNAVDHLPGWPIINFDGAPINQGNFRAVYDLANRDGRPFVIWASDARDGNIPQHYLDPVYQPEAEE